MLVSGEEIMLLVVGTRLVGAYAFASGPDGSWVAVDRLRMPLTMLADLTAEGEGTVWCRGHDFDSPAARALRVAGAL